ncbi:MAG: restriction endonuclease subunit S [Sakamotonia sp.]|jgi:type I restriction enzyme S subunit
MEKMKIGDVCNILNGFAFKSENYMDLGIRIIRIANVQKGFIEDTMPVFYPITSEGLDKYMLEEGDLLISLTGNVGRVALLEKKMLPAALNQRVACLRLKTDKISKRYLFHILNSNYFEQQCIQSSKGVAQKNMSTEWLKEYEIPLYPIEQQAEIISVLDKIGLIMADRAKELKKLNDLIKARFAEMFGNPVNNDRGWECKLLNDICDGIGDGLHGTPEYDDNGGYPFINGNNLIDGEIVITPATKMVSEETYKKHLIDISPNAILISINGTLGKLAFYNGEQVMLGKSACYCNLKSSVNKVFVYGVMKSDAFAEFLDNSSTKSTIKNVGLKAIREYKLILPPTKLQEQFAAFVKQTEKSKVVIQKSFDEMQLLFDSLMQKYFG